MILAIGWCCSTAIAGGTRSSSGRARSGSSLGHTAYHRSGSTTSTPPKKTTQTTSTVYRPGITHSAAVAEMEAKKNAPAEAKKAADKKKADEAKKKQEEEEAAKPKTSKPKVATPAEHITSPKPISPFDSHP